MALYADQADRDRRDWARSQRVGTQSAVFFPGDELRCPTLVNPRTGERCGSGLRLWAKPGHQTIVRKLMALPWPADRGVDGYCIHCRSKLEIFPILEATG